ncbi:hypothetical protein AOC36_10445 [Erysipelothrix larvae]|uniref:Acid-resistance membrane protein n=1 Tax=Erysipelothrix larvae TaxID=1514105 RepID=A0A0X8H1J1_9FIRM|nr:DUF308 domain-containing protein [Erysipelothrix larvae]AMC94375.1 hypothetical protein AOC36_10445 [Erysipelothrix larvae]
MNIKKIVKNICITRIIFGALLVVLGVYSLMNPSTVISTLGFAFALYALISGIIDIAMYFVFDSKFGYAPSLSMIGGIISIVAGVIMFMNPTSTAFMISLLFPIWFMSTCISKITQLPLIRHYSGTASYWFSLIVSALGIVLSIYLLFNPLTSLLYTVSFVAVYLLFYGFEVFIEGILGLNRSKEIL